MVVYLQNQHTEGDIPSLGYQSGVFFSSAADDVRHMVVLWNRFDRLSLSREWKWTDRVNRRVSWKESGWLAKGEFC